MTSVQRWTLVSVCTATFMLLLDITIVNVALPKIAEDLHASFSDTQWVVDAYALSLASLLLTAGSLADLLGRRLVFTVGLVVFTVASLLCGLAQSSIVLDLARALQGVGGAAMFATSLALLAAAFHGHQRGMAFGIWGATTGAAVAIGPLVGGVLTEHVSWQSIFYINIPIGALAVVGSLGRLQESRDANARGVDVPGVVTFTGGLFMLIFALVRGNAEGWGSPLIVGLLVGAVVFLVAFVLVERHSDRAMLDLSLFRKASFRGVSFAAFALSSGMFAMFLYFTFYIQNALGYSPLQAGLRFLPTTLLSFAVAPISGRLTSHVAPRLLLGGGLLLVAAGLGLDAILVDAESGWTALLPGFLLTGAGIGMTNPPLASTAIAVVTPDRAGMASGINNTFRQVGIATGIAALGALFQVLLEHQFPGGPSGSVLAQGLPQVLGPGHREAFLAGYTSALDVLFLIGAGISLAGAAAAFLLVRREDFAGYGSPPTSPPPPPERAPEPARA